MKIFQVEVSANPKEVGRIPQVTNTTIQIDRAILRNYQTLNRRGFPDEMPRLDIFKFNPNAKPTDVLSSTYTQIFAGILVNNKVQHILII